MCTPGPPAAFSPVLWDWHLPPHHLLSLGPVSVSLPFQSFLPSWWLPQFPCSNSRPCRAAEVMERPRVGQAPLSRGPRGEAVARSGRAVSSEAVRRGACRSPTVQEGVRRAPGKHSLACLIWLGKHLTGFPGAGDIFQRCRRQESEAVKSCHRRCWEAWYQVGTPEGQPGPEMFVRLLRTPC